MCNFTPSKHTENFPPAVTTEAIITSPSQQKHHTTTKAQGQVRKLCKEVDGRSPEPAKGNRCDLHTGLSRKSNSIPLCPHSGSHA